MPGFEVAQLVQWNPKAKQQGHLDKMRTKHGDGPFRVQSVKDLPIYCNCGAVEAGTLEHSLACAISLLDSRPQLITIKTNKGWREFAEEWLSIVEEQGEDDAGNTG